MAKHRKTRQEKMIADQRHVVYHLEPSSTEVRTPSAKKSESTSTYTLETPTYRPAVASYAYVTADLRKTFLITAAIIIAQIFLFIVLNRV